MSLKALADLLDNPHRNTADQERLVTAAALAVVGDFLNDVKRIADALERRPFVGQIGEVILPPEDEEETDENGVVQPSVSMELHDRITNEVRLVRDICGIDAAKQIVRSFGFVMLGDLAKQTHLVDQVAEACRKARSDHATANLAPCKGPDCPGDERG